MCFKWNEKINVERWKYNLKQIKEIKLTEKFVSSLGIKLYPKVKIKKENYTALKETRKTQVALKFLQLSCALERHLLSLR